MPKPKLLRVTTVPISLKLLLRGQLSFMKEQGFEVLAVSADGPEIKDLKAEGVDHRIVSMTRKITPFQDVISLLKLIGLIRSFRPDIVHSHTPKAGMLAMLAAWICRVPVRLHTVAGLPLIERKGAVRTVLVLTEKLTYFCATKIYPNSVGLKDFIESDIGIDPSKLSLIGKGSSNGIDVRAFFATDALLGAATDLRKKLSVSSTEIVFSFVGRIVGDKGINELIAAFQRIAAEFPARLLLVGPQEADLDPIAPESQQALANDPRIHALGYQQDVRPALLASDLFVFPSYREGFPNVVMQACCLERPCIVSNINGCNEIIQDGITGLIVPTKDTDALYNAMKWMSTHPDAARKFGRDARAYVAANFDQRHVWESIMKEYKEALTHV
jgi:glycosyltransferase involved in cell wall biosynthesis